MRTLIVLRHAKSDWSGNEPDHDRPLASRGRRQAPEAGEWLNAHAGPIDLALVSTATRARQTWKRASAELDTPPPVRLEERLYAATASEMQSVLDEVADHDTVVLVGHNPGVEDLVRQLTGQWVPLPTSAIAVLDLAGDGSATLRAAGRPPT